MKCRETWESRHTLFISIFLLKKHFRTVNDNNLRKCSFIMALRIIETLYLDTLFILCGEIKSSQLKYSEYIHLH